MPYIISVKDCLKVNKVYYILFSVMVLLVACEIKLKPNEELGDVTSRVEVQRYDRLQSRYLTTGDFSALQNVSADYFEDRFENIDIFYPLRSIFKDFPPL